MEDGSISNGQITASDYYQSLGILFPWKGRLNGADYWATRDSRPSDPWIQVDLLNTITVVGIKIQGAGSAHSHEEWVMRLKLQTGESENALTFIMENNRPKVRELNVLSNFI